MQPVQRFCTYLEVRLKGQLVPKGQFRNLLPVGAPSAAKTKRVESYVGLRRHPEGVQFRNIWVKEL